MRNTGLPVTVSVSELAETHCPTFFFFFFLNSSHCCLTNGQKNKTKKVSHAALITFKCILLHRPVESVTVNESIQNLYLLTK